MPQCVVIADDLTGANATGVLLKKMNYTAYTVMNTERIELSTLKDCDCVLYPTDSRGVDPGIAYNRVYNVCDLLKNDEVKVYSKRIDSTLRGNLGSETDAMLDCLGEDYVAVVAPCFPSSGRIVIGGYMLVNGLPLHKTDIAIDPKTPVKISEDAVLFAEQSKYKVASVLMKDLMHGKHYLADLMKKHVEEGCRILVVDCVTQEDLDLIADAVITSKLKIVAVDPGVFTSTLSRKLITPSEKKEKSRILAVVGSFFDARFTQNTRTAYPIENITNAIVPSMAGHPNAIIFLTADAFGVLPPIAKLTKEQAMYHFLSGYTSKVAGTERGITEPQATFSIGFGEPFFPLPPLQYARLLGEKINQYNTSVYLVNTGWTGGPYGVGKRMELKYTRAMISAALDGKLDDVTWTKHEYFQLNIPDSCPGVPSEVLNPENTWMDKKAYKNQAEKLVRLFAENVKRFAGEMPEEILNAGPRLED